MDDCIFCRIARGELETVFRYQDEDVLAFPDINAQAPVHLLVITRKHIPSLGKMEEGDYGLLSKVYRVIHQLAGEEGVVDRGYRVVVNCNEEGGQTVPHLHFHLLGGRYMNWPPG